jgi:uracil-DNA glycosylase family 4
MCISELNKSITNCTLCSDTLSKYNILPKPIFSGTRKASVMLIGQAPGITEYKIGKPFKGATGDSIKLLFSLCGINDFDNYVYQTSVTKCFPGRKVNFSTDRLPSQKEVLNCSPFLFQQIKILKPKIIVCLGMLSWKTLIILKNKEQLNFSQMTYQKTISKLTTKDIIGNSFIYNESIVIPMIHPSGAANGSRAKNKYAHEKSIELLKKNIKELKISTGKGNV